MTKTEIKSLIKEAAANMELIALKMKFFSYNDYFIPLLSSDKLFLSIKENDFIFDGYHIYTFKDVRKAELKTGMYDKMLKKEGIATNITVPTIELTNWKTVFESLKAMNKNIIVEKQTIDDKDSDFYIGRIGKVYNKFIYFWYFDADGIWEDKPYKIFYTDITNVSFGTRYVDTFSKYINEPPISY